MWPFSRRREEKPEKSHIARKLVAGIIIGGAIGSIIGKRLMEKAQQEEEGDAKKKE